MKRNDFELTAIIWHEVQNKINVEPLETLLNNHLNLSDYGSRIKKIYFVFIAVRPQNKLHENKLEFHSNSGRLEVALQLNYKDVVNSNKKEIQVMMTRLILGAVELYKGISKVDFDWKKFKQDCIDLINYI